MSRNNDVFSVLVTTDNQAIATTGGPGALTAGQLGIYDADTNVAVTAGTITAVGAPKEFYIAVGTANGPRFSAGQKITSRGIVSAKEKDYVVGVNPIYEINDYVGAANTEYAIKFEFQNNEIYQTQGFVPFTKAYSIMTPCSPTGDDANEVTRLFLDQFNADPKVQFTAEAITNDALTIVTHGVSADFSAGAVISYADLLVVRDFNIANSGSLTTGIQITTIPVPVTSFNDVDLLYSYPRETKALISFVTGFGCNGTISDTATVLVYGQGLGIDVKRLEYMANGWKGTPGPYRVSSVTGLAKNNVEYFASEAINYDMISIEHDNIANAAWAEYKNNMTTNIAIPIVGTTTYSQLIAVLNPILALSGQGALS